MGSDFHLLTGSLVFLPWHLSCLTKWSSVIYPTTEYLLSTFYISNIVVGIRVTKFRKKQPLVLGEFLI